MDVKIGISDLPRELSVRTEQSADEVAEALRTALESNSLFELTDEKGRRVLIPAARVGYLDLGSEDSRPVGFGSV